MDGVALFYFYLSVKNSEYSAPKIIKSNLSEEEVKQTMQCKTYARGFNSFNSFGFNEFILSIARGVLIEY